MRFTSVFSTLIAVAAVNGAANNSAIDTITKDLKGGDFIKAANDILTLGNCDLSHLAGCVGVFAPIIVDCGQAVIAQGANVSENLACFSKALGVIGSGPKGFDSCTACIEEGISVAESLITDL
ncbi:hypothetical protein FE257_005170 [Aspergillus nanangensis]|uniref:Fungal calcium binding protein domain-containing protein n=1 Tax=Aspergillus nanangensis TaxID=2582783 RepID=A0AAD4CAD2_ASPNN|nr:hypothetical protein FE257_005170 [Aspergillus nanangensis]